MSQEGCDKGLSARQHVAPRYAVIDLETTGLRSCDRIVEVAVLVLDEQGLVKTAFDSLVNPGRSPGPVRIHGITSRECRRAPRFSELARDLYSLLVGSVLVAHNLSFDWAHLRRDFERCGVTFMAEPWGLCTAQGCRTLGMPASLGAACRTLGLSTDTVHGARADAEATRRLWLALRRRHAFVVPGAPLRPGIGWHRLAESVPAHPRRVGMSGPKSAGEEARAEVQPMGEPQ